jgi:hypothetical protein
MIAHLDNLMFTWAPYVSQFYLTEAESGNIHLWIQDNWEVEARVL